MVASLCLGAFLVVDDALAVQVAPPAERDAVSTRGWVLGYAGGGILLTLVLVTAHRAEGLRQAAAVRASLLSAGLWWGVSTPVPYRGLRALDARGPALGDVPPANRWERPVTEPFCSEHGVAEVTLRVASVRCPRGTPRPR